MSDDTPELKKIARLLGILAVRELHQNDQVRILYAVGFSYEEVAELLGTSQNNVRLIAHRARKKPRQRPANRGK